MNKLLLALLVGTLLMAGCGVDEKSGTDSSESNQTSAETIDLDDPETRKKILAGAIDWDVPETRKKILAGAIDYHKLQFRARDKILAGPGARKDKKERKEEESESERRYAPDQQTPYTGWVKLMWENGQLRWLLQCENGKAHGLHFAWDQNGKKLGVAIYKNGQKAVLRTTRNKNGEMSSSIVESGWASTNPLDHDTFDPLTEIRKAKESGATILNLDNEIQDLTPLTGLTKLTKLSLGNNGITDLTPLAGLTNLNYLYLSNNNITDLTPLANLTNLKYLYLAENNISDLTPLKGLTKLNDLILVLNDIDNNQETMISKALPKCIIRIEPRRF